MILLDFSSVSKKLLESKDTRAASGKGNVYCARCKSDLTHLDYAVEIDNHHVHQYVNPSGVTFRVGCYSQAPGCGTSGGPTTEYTWFAGYQWCYAHCKSCAIHVGWWFTNGPHQFYALITARIAHDDA